VSSVITIPIGRKSRAQPVLPLNVILPVCMLNGRPSMFDRGEKGLKLLIEENECSPNWKRCTIPKQFA
jgi:hypothetical protein